MIFKAWLIGIVLAAVVTLWSWNGGLVLPFIKSKLYKRALTMMISLAFGVMSANSILKYLPLVSQNSSTCLLLTQNLVKKFHFSTQKADGFENKSLEETQYTYFYKHLIILAGLFFFFVFERSMKLFAIHKTAVSFRRLQVDAFTVRSCNQDTEMISNKIEAKRKRTHQKGGR